MKHRGARNRPGDYYGPFAAAGGVNRTLTALRKATKGTENLMPSIYAAVKAYATLGEICDAMRDTFGTYEEVAIT